MDDFSNNDAESWGKFTTGNNPIPNMPAFARIVLHGSSERMICSVKVSRNLSVEIADMLIGPFNLFINPSERSLCHEHRLAENCCIK